MVLVDEYDVVVVGGGIVGAGVLRDLALRGLKAALIDKNDFSSGATGRSHALLHSGARYVVKDPESAKECAEENKILKKIAGHIVEDTGGLFVGFSVDPDDYIDKFETGCRRSGVYCRELTPKEAIELEPELNKNIKYVFEVDDGHVDPFRLTYLNILDALENNAEIFNYTRFLDIVSHQDQVIGVKVYDEYKNETRVIKTNSVVFATGAWTGKILIGLGVDITVSPNRGTLIVYSGRIFERVINRLRPPSDGDIIVPSYGTSILGTTSVDVDDPEDYNSSEDEVRILMKEAKVMSKKLSETRIIRIYAGTRPLIAKGGREATRGFEVIDLDKEINLEGAFAIVGGKLTTYRLMAEKISDLVSRYLGIGKRSKTAKIPLPGYDEHSFKRVIERARWNSNAIIKAFEKWGSVAQRFFIKPFDYEIACPCEQVTVGEVKYSVRRLKARTLMDVLRRTRAGMGPCQGLNCVLRIAGIIASLDKNYNNIFMEDLKSFLERKWRGSALTIDREQFEQISLQRKSMYQIMGAEDE